MSSLLSFMPYKNIEDRKENTKNYYYKNREKRIKYQREYDKNNKKKKAIYDKLRRKKDNYNKIKRTQHFSLRVHLPKLIKKYGKCQICNSKKNLEIHHKKYDTKKIEDCMLLCSKCHKKLHRKYK